MYKAGIIGLGQLRITSIKIQIGKSYGATLKHIRRLTIRILFPFVMLTKV